MKVVRCDYCGEEIKADGYNLNKYLSLNFPNLSHKDHIRSGKKEAVTLLFGFLNHHDREFHYCGLPCLVKAIKEEFPDIENISSANPNREIIFARR